MDEFDEIKAIAKQVWPDADHLDITPARSGHSSYAGPDPDDVFRLTAIHRDGSILGQVIADSLEDLESKLRQLLQGTSP